MLIAALLAVVVFVVFPLYALFSYWAEADPNPTHLRRSPPPPPASLGPYLDAERRLRLGITQIPGGRAVFGPMSVVDNLRAFGTTVRRDKTALDSAIDLLALHQPVASDLRRIASVLKINNDIERIADLSGVRHPVLVIPRDGLLDVLSVCGIARLELMRELARIHRGGHLANPKVTLARGRTTASSAGGRSSATARATRRIAAPTRTAIRTWSHG